MTAAERACATAARPVRVMCVKCLAFVVRHAPPLPSAHRC